MSSCNKIYITTPIYYVNDEAHIGHAYTTIIADAVSRYSKLLGYETFLLTGTDEHGQKIEESAKKRGRTPKEYADEISGKFKQLWDDFGIKYDHFIRTTDDYHKKGVQIAFEKMFQKGDIYKGSYSGNYCISCESFFTNTQLIGENSCPDCGKETKVIEEESYFFRLSNYEDKLLELYEKNPEFILPTSKRNEIISFVQGGLKDLSISRTSFDWGVKLPESMNEPHHVMYVWLDALLNYITALGYGDDEKNMDFWSAKTHIVGKDILRFHAIYWPAFLMSLDLPLPHHISAHGWWTRDGQKMSKSVGNIVKPREVVDAYGIDTFRYFLLREVPFGQDGDFSEKALINRINGDLGNSLGNLLNRLIGMGDKYFLLKFSASLGEFESQLAKVDEIISGLEKHIFKMQIHRYLEDIWEILAIGNGAIQKSEPWAKIKTNPDEVESLLVFISNLLSRVSLLIYPIMPKSGEEMAKALNVEISAESYKKIITEKDVRTEFKIQKVSALFPRVDKPKMKQEEKKEEKPKELKIEGVITIDKFFETKIKIGEIIEVEELPKSDKLYKMRVDLGEERPRQILAGIRKYYKKEELLNTQVCVVANLKPAKLMGHMSEGMVLAGKDENGLSLIRPEKPRKIGTPIS
ncbi:protein containing C-terminal region/beta chain of methionyl-tRNA synthetase [Thiovulum sp. ES]|nr:protein containing C-terminal region/beta chain of methionyl-tRNA synthetase [Thiovulum sp. ES]